MAEPRHQAPDRRPLVSVPAAIVIAFALVIVAFVVVGKDEYAYNLAATGLVAGVALVVWVVRRR